MQNMPHVTQIPIQQPLVYHPLGGAEEEAWRLAGKNWRVKISEDSDHPHIMMGCLWLHEMLFSTHLKPQTMKTSKNEKLGKLRRQERSCQLPAVARERQTGQECAVHSPRVGEMALSLWYHLQGNGHQQGLCAMKQTAGSQKEEHQVARHM